MKLKVYALKPYRPELKGLVRDVRISWLLEELGVAYELISMDALKKENRSEIYLKINPTGKVPSIVDGDFSLYESGAIMEYLSHKHRSLTPTQGEPAYFECKQWFYSALTNLDPQCARVFSADFLLDKSEASTTIRQLAVEQINRFLPVLNSQLETKKFIGGNEISIADIATVTSLNYIQHTQIVDPYPNLKKYIEACTKRPAFQRAAATCS